MEVPHLATEVCDYLANLGAFGKPRNKNLCKMDFQLAIGFLSNLPAVPSVSGFLVMNYQCNVSFQCVYFC